MDEAELRYLLGLKMSGANFPQPKENDSRACRDRWVRCMHFHSVDRIPNEEFGYWDDTFVVWHTQGLPDFVTDNEKADIFFGFDRRDIAPVNIGLHPTFEYRVLEEDDQYRIIVDTEGVKGKIMKSGDSSIPQYLEFPIKTRLDFERFRERLNPETFGRYPSNWNVLVHNWKHRDYPLGINLGSLFGWIRDWMGFEGVALACHDDPKFITEMMDCITNLVMLTVQKALKEVQFDYGSIWEDMAFNQGPIISPRMFSEFMVSRYKKITDLLKQHGCDVVYVDCDGNMNELVSLWIEGGVKGMFPIEVASGTEPEKWRERFGEQVLLLGGIDKRQLAKGKKEICTELKRVQKLVRQGGYIPFVDHRVPPNVSYKDYLYYLDAKRDILGT
jgi:uroporphyrinogen decarboxylase